MSAPGAQRPPTGPQAPPYRAALGVTAAVLLLYVLTLASTVTFWDAGEFIAAARILGIPHPPGTPLFVMIAHVWAMLVPVGEFALRTNLLSALFSAAGAGCMFLVVHASLRSAFPADDRQARTLALAGAAAAAVAGAATFTQWQNSNETEVYAVSTFSIAAMAWLAHRWRDARSVGADAGRATRLLLLIVYLAGVSIGNHLLALLAGPAIVVFLVATARERPLADSLARRQEWGRTAVVAGVWALLIGCGLGSTTLTVVGGLCFAAAAIYAAAAGAGSFALLSLVIASVGVTPYLYLYIRSGQHPVINEAAPASFDALLAVIRRAQYPVRTPFDDPTVPHGDGNPGRSLAIIGIQLADYAVYFSWQWAKSLSSAPLQVAVALLFTGLGLKGARLQYRADRAAWWLLLTLFLVTGLGLVAYMNFRPGYGRWYEQFPSGGAHEVRERDYFFVVSFIVWGLWAGMGATSLVVAGAARGAWRKVAPAALLIPLLPIALNATAASRRHGPDARLAADFAYDLLNSVPPYGVLFTYGDNDTFPLWWAQEVAGIRRDVTVVCLALANTDWYMRQLRDNPVRPLDAGALPKVWQGRDARPPSIPLHGMTDEAIETALNGFVVREAQTVALGPLRRALRPGTILYPSDLLMLSVIQQNVGRRPLLWSVTAGREFGGLGDYVVQRGLGFELGTSRPDSTSPALDFRRISTAPLDVRTTEALVYRTYRYADLLQRGAERLETTSGSIAASLSLPFTQLAYAAADRQDTVAMRRALDRAIMLSPNADLRAALTRMRLEGGPPAGAP